MQGSTIAEIESSAEVGKLAGIVVAIAELKVHKRNLLIYFTYLSSRTESDKIIKIVIIKLKQIV